MLTCKVYDGLLCSISYATTCTGLLSSMVAWPYGLHKAWRKLTTKLVLVISTTPATAGVQTKPIVWKNYINGPIDLCIGHIARNK